MATPKNSKVARLVFNSRLYPSIKYNSTIKPAIDVSIALVLCALFIVPMVFIAACIFVTSKGPILYWTERLGINEKPFQMPKFRTMLVNAPLTSTKNFVNPDKYITPIGRLLRFSSLDELPQLLCVLKGEMSLVGPRPAILRQKQINKLRRKAGIGALKPGITGWAQINGRDKITDIQKVALDTEYLQRQSLFFDLKILCKTTLYVLSSKNVTH